MTSKAMVKRDHPLALWNGPVLSRLLDRTFDIESFLPSAFRNQPNSVGFSPAMDVAVKDNTVTLKLDVPGLSKEDLNIQYDSGYLTVSGERKTETNDNGYIERSYGSFSRKQYIGEVNKENIEASLDNGVLTITAPIAEQKVDEAHRIEIK